MLSAGGIRHQFSRGVNVEMSQYGSEFLASVPERMRIDASHDAPDIQFVEGGYLFLASHKNVQILYDNYETQRYVVLAFSFGRAGLCEIALYTRAKIRENASM
jgi:hypothetical protein